MTRPREIPDLVQWHEGMLLAPQHFQQMSLRAEALLHYQLAVAAPYHWGIRRLRIDPVGLLSGLYRIVELEATMPDGLVVTRNAGDAGSLEVSLVDYAGAAAQRPVVVQLVVPSRRAGAGRGTGDGARYASYEDGDVTDMNTGDTALAVPRLRPQPSLFIGVSAPEKYVSLPLAHVTYRDEAFQLDGFIPPSTSVPPEEELGRLCADVVRRVREKAAYLADRARATTAAEQEPLVLQYRSMARTLAAGLPPVEVLLRTGVAHPFPVYLALCGLVGQCAGAGSGVVPPVLRGYEHANLRVSFAEITAFFDELLGEIREEFQRIPFTESAGTFELTIQPHWLRAGGEPMLIGAVPPAGIADSDLLGWFEQTVIAGKTRLAAVRERRIRGCGRSRVAAPEAIGLAPRRGEIIFAVDADPQYLGIGDVLQVLHPGAGEHGRPRELTLYVAADL